MAKRTDNAQLNVLFIGNSFTARHGLPGLIRAMAAERGRHMEQRLISAGGASLARHWNAGDALKEIESNRYDYVVLQEQSTLPIKNPKRMHESVRQFHEAIRAAGSKTVLYMTWARQYAPESQRAIADAYLSVGRELEAIVVPVGQVWQRFMSKRQEPVLYDLDQSHPSVAGSYLAACVFYAVLFGDSPVGLRSSAVDLEPKAMQSLQKSAWQAYKPKY